MKYTTMLLSDVKFKKFVTKISVMNTGKVANNPTIFPVMQRANPAFLENLGLGDARATGKKSLGISGIHLY